MYIDNFSWIRRIKVALEFAKLLEFLHEGEWPFVVFNIDSTNIMLDQVGFDVAFLSIKILRLHLITRWKMIEKTIDLCEKVENVKCSPCSFL